MPSEYEFSFKTNGTFFRYGFSHDKDKIWEEWLYETPATPSKRQRRWFSRVFEPEIDGYVWSINSDYISEGNRLKKGSRSNSLFLSSAVRDNCESLQGLFDWFRESLHIIRANERISFSSTASQLLENKSHEIKHLLKSSGVTFDDIDVKEREISKDDLSFLDETPKELQQLLLKELDGKKEFDVKFIYKTKTQGKVSLPLSDESDGTRALFGLAFPLIDVLQHSATLVIDELHNNLHPNLLRHVVSLFNNQTKPEDAAQLIFSSHDTSILSPINLS